MREDAHSCHSWSIMLAAMTVKLQHNSRRLVVRKAFFWTQVASSPFFFLRRISTFRAPYTFGKRKAYTFKKNTPTQWSTTVFQNNLYCAVRPNASPSSAKHHTLRPCQALGQALSRLFGQTQRLRLVRVKKGFGWNKTCRKMRLVSFNPKKKKESCSHVGISPLELCANIWKTSTHDARCSHFYSLARTHVRVMMWLSRIFYARKEKKREKKTTMSPHTHTYTHIHTHFAYMCLADVPIRSICYSFHI